MTAFDHQLASEIIQQIYYSVCHPEGWQNTVAAIAQACNAEGCAIWISDIEQPEISMLATTFQNSEIYAGFSTGYAADNPFFAPLKQAPEGRMFTTEELIPREELIKTERYQQLWKPGGVDHVFGGFLHREGDRVALLWLFRGPGEPFASDETQMLGHLRPHLIQALTMRGQLMRADAVAGTGMAALDRLAMAMILLDAEGVPVAHNNMARILADEGILQLAPGGLGFNHAADNSRLKELVAAVNQGSTGVDALGGGFRVESGNDGGDLEVLVLPYRSGDSIVAPVSCLVIVKRGASAQALPRQQLLRDIYCLTEAEVRVCSALQDGISIKDIALEQGVSPDAVRFHCKSILRKTGTHRQPDLVRTLSLSLVNLGGD